MNNERDSLELVKNKRANVTLVCKILGPPCEHIAMRPQACIKSSSPSPPNTIHDPTHSPSFSPVQFSFPHYPLNIDNLIHDVQISTPSIRKNDLKWLHTAMPAYGRWIEKNSHPQWQPPDWHPHEPLQLEQLHGADSTEEGESVSNGRNIR